MKQPAPSTTGNPELPHPIDLHGNERFRGYLALMQRNRRLSILLPLAAMVCVLACMYLLLYLLPALHYMLFDPAESKRLAARMPEGAVSRFIFPLPADTHFFSMLAGITVLAMVIYFVWFLKQLKMRLEGLGGFTLTRENGGELYRIIENTALMLGMPLPKVLVIDAGVRNALTFGFRPGKSTLLLTRGLLESLNRPEFEAVVAHAFANIRLHNTAFITTLQGYFGPLLDDVQRKMKLTPAQLDLLLALALGLTIFGFLVHPGILMGLSPFLITFGFFLPLLWLRAHTLQARTALTDALALEITRDPQAYISALHKLAGHDGLVIRNSSLMESLMFSGNGNGIIAAHPPLSERTRAILRAWRTSEDTSHIQDMPDLHLPHSTAPPGSPRRRTISSGKRHEIDLGVRGFDQLFGSARQQQDFNPYKLAGAVIIATIYLILSAKYGAM